MGKVEAFTLPGLEAWFNSSDHLPPHIHIKRRGEWEIRVMIRECSDGRLEFDHKWGGRGPSSAEKTAILIAVLQHRTALLMEWERKVCRPT